MNLIPLHELCVDIIDCPHETPNWKTSGVRVIRNYNLSNGRVNDESPSYVDEATYERRTRRANPAFGDIVISREAPMGPVAMIPRYKCCLGQRLVLLKPNKTKCDNRYLLYALMSDFVQQQIKRADSTGSIVSNLNIPDLKELRIPLPDLESQHFIADCIDSIVSKIENNYSIISELEAMARDIYDYWFVQFDFPDENGKPYKSSGGKMVWNDELKMEIPEGWKQVKFGNLFSFVKGRIPEGLSEKPTDSYSSPYLTIDVANDGNPLYCNPSSMVYCNGQVIMVMDGAASGDVYLGNKGSLGSTFSMLPSKRQDISNAMLFMILKSNKVLYKRANTGSTVPHANRSFIENMKTALPEDVSSFGDTFELIFEYVTSLRIENRELKCLRDWLLPMLLNGQVKVGGVA